MEFFTDYNDQVACRTRARHLFTPAEADRSLVLVERIVKDVVVEYARMIDLQEAIEAAEPRYDWDTSDLCDQMLSTAEGLRACLDELDCVGVELCDWSRGIVDFPCMIGGREVRLCWRYGEDSVSHWHDIDGGCGCREPLCGVGIRKPVGV